MAQPIDTIGKAVRRGMLVRAECRLCGNIRHYRSSDLMMVFGGGRDPLDLKFKCTKCSPVKGDISILLIDIDLDRPPKGYVWVPFWDGGKVVAWMPERFRP